MDKKFLYKCLLGIIVTVLLFYICNTIYKKDGWQKDLNKLNESDMLIHTIEGSSSADILYFAESSNATVAESDSIKKSIAELTNDHFPDLKIVSIERGAIHAGVYKELIRRIEGGRKVSSIIVTMNLRSFNSDWINSSFENGCQELCTVYQPYPELLNKMRLLFKAYDYKEEWKRRKIYWDDICNTEINVPAPLSFKTTREWDKYAADNWYRDSNGVIDYPKLNLACHNIKAFAFNIDTLTNPRIKDFDKIVELGKEKNIKVYFNLLAENTQYADSLVGKELVKMMEDNRALLVNRYTKRGAVVIDNLELVNGKSFIDQTWTTEHYDQEGRKIIAANVAKYLKKQYSGY
jgi:hypothetical protein